MSTLLKETANVQEEYVFDDKASVNYDFLPSVEDAARRRDYWNPSKYTEDGVLTNYDLEKALEKDDFLSSDMKIPENARLRQKPIKPRLESYDSFWEPKPFVYGGKRVVNQSPWDSNATVYLTKEKEAKQKPTSSLSKKLSGACSRLFSFIKNGRK